MKEITITEPTRIFFDRASAVRTYAGGMYEITPPKEKTLQEWWKEYWGSPDTYAEISSVKDMAYINSWSILGFRWFILVDFYRWLADQLNEGFDTTKEWEELWYEHPPEGDDFSIMSCGGEDSVSSIVRHAPGTGQKVIDLLGMEILRKIYQV